MTTVRSLVNRSVGIYDVEHPNKQTVVVSIGEIGKVLSASVLSYPDFPPVESIGKRFVLWPSGTMLMEFSEIEIVEE